MLLPDIFNNNFSDDFFSDLFTPLEHNSLLRVDNMRSDIKELDDSYEINMQLPGYSKEDVKAELKDGYLTISANHEDNVDEKDDNGKYIRKECYRGSCQRSFYVGDGISKEDIKAEFKEGMLKLKLTKNKMLPENEDKQLIQIEG